MPTISPALRKKLIAKLLTSPEREALWKRVGPSLEKYLTDVGETTPSRAYMYGSFTSKKPNPQDIDIQAVYPKSAKLPSNHESGTLVPWSDSFLSMWDKGALSEADIQAVFSKNPNKYSPLKDRGRVAEIFGQVSSLENRKSFYTTKEKTKEGAARGNRWIRILGILGALRSLEEER